MDEERGFFWTANPELDAEAEELARQPVTIEDFVCFMPTSACVFLPTGDMWASSSVNARIPTVEIGAGKTMTAARWLARNRPVEQMSWAPGEPVIIADRLLIEGAGWIEHRGARVLNLYRPPIIRPGEPELARPWLDHVHRVYPDDVDHILRWLAQRVQRPEIKLNHALVLGGNPGVGKDTLLVPVRHAIGPWNSKTVSPSQMLSRFNGFLRATILLISEVRDLGEHDRFQFYERAKTIIAAPPDTLSIDEKNIREYPIVNVVGVNFDNQLQGRRHLSAAG
jgi:hypothetical protein